MAISLETQEILIAFADENKGNHQSWGKYELDELQDAYAEISAEEKASTTGQRIKERIDELETGKDHLEEIKQEESSAIAPEDVPLQELFSEDQNDNTDEQVTPLAQTPEVTGSEATTHQRTDVARSEATTKQRTDIKEKDKAVAQHGESPKNNTPLIVGGVIIVVIIIIILTLV